MFTTTITVFELNTLLVKCEILKHMKNKQHKELLDQMSAANRIILIDYLATNVMYKADPELTVLPDNVCMFNIISHYDVFIPGKTMRDWYQKGWVQVYDGDGIVFTEDALNAHPCLRQAFTRVGITKNYKNKQGVSQVRKLYELRLLFIDAYESKESMKKFLNSQTNAVDKKKYTDFACNETVG